MFSQTAVAALLAGIAAAYHAPVTGPSGNAINAPLNEVVPACKPFTIKWTPSTTGPVSLLLLKGPSTNVVYYKTIAEGIANSGSYVWTPDSDIPATGGDPHGYGIQLITDAEGQYQYSTQFGISTDDCKGKPSSSSSSSGYPTSSPTPSKTPISSNSSTICSTTTTYVSSSSSAYPYTTGGAVNSTIVLPTKSMTVPSSLLTTATTAPSGKSSAPAQATGAASGLQAGAGLAGAVAGLFMLL